MRRQSLYALLLACCAQAAWAIEPFVVKDIRVEGIQRTDPGTVFNYLPIKVGDRVDDERVTAAIKALYATGFFKDVRLEGQDGVLIVSLLERPTIASIELVGAHEFDKDTLTKALKDIGLAESRIFDKSSLDRAEQEIKRQYISRGYYSAEVATTVTPLERNRVAVNFTITEGDVTKITRINIVGNTVFSEKELLDQLQLRTPGWFTWYTKDDQYSKQKLSADLENLRSYYTNRGYLEMNLESTQVSITPNKREIYITINISEGPKYAVSEVNIAGQLLIPESDVRKLISLAPGDTFSRQKLTESSKRISDRLANDGYAFANVNAIPELQKDKREVAFTFFIDPGHRVYVRRININGNTRTRDEVLRREMRQLEGGWYDASKIDRSKVRLERLGYFKDINVETPPVQGFQDQVDVDVTVTEKPTGSILLGVGYSSGDGIVLSGSISQQNVFGTGNSIIAQINSGRVNRIYSVSYTNPYWTDDGIARGFDLYDRYVDPSVLSLGNYKYSTLGAGVRFGVPISETNSINLGLAGERTKVTIYDGAPQRFIEYVNLFGYVTDAVVASAGWAEDSRDSITYPTHGQLRRLFGELGLPGGRNLKYYRVNAQEQIFFPVYSPLTLMLNVEYGYGGGYGGQPFPFFKNFYAGGVTSVRGYEESSLGPRDTNGDILGGRERLVGNAEFLFPLPGVKNDKSVRGSIFFDAGEIRGDGNQPQFESFRYSTGIAVAWQSPLGLLKFSLAQPLKTVSGDNIQRFQFQFGNVF